jgi:hypothetical protein
MALDSTDRCKVCGTPYLSALGPGESEADRICYTCHPSGPAKSRPADEADDELVLVEEQKPAVKTKNAREVRKPARVEAPSLQLPSDAPNLPPRPPDQYVQTSGNGVWIVAGVMVMLMISVLGYQFYQRYIEPETRPVKAEPPPVPPPEPPPAPVPVAPPRAKRIEVKPFKPDMADPDDFKPVHVEPDKSKAPPGVAPDADMKPLPPAPAAQPAPKKLP